MDILRKQETCVMPRKYVTDKHAVALGFSRAASTYNEHAAAQQAFAQQLCGLLSHEVADLASKGSASIKLADLGCGTGFLTAGLRTIFPQAKIIGFDMAEAMVQKCRAEFSGNTSFSCLDVEEDDFGGGYDFVASSYALQWVDCPAVFKRIYAALNKSGLFALALPVAGSFPELIQAYKQAEIRNAPMLDYMDGDALTDVLGASGFSVLHQHQQKLSVFYPDSLNALRSFRCCGASFTHHQGHRRLNLREAKKLLRAYDGERVERENRVAITYNTLYVIARREG